MVFSSLGRSRPTIWVCRARVAVETRVGLSLVSEWAISGIRYANDLPVPVPAWTSRWSPVSMARATCRAISCWPSRLWPPIPATARSRSSTTNSSPDGPPLDAPVVDVPSSDRPASGDAAASPATAGSVIAEEGVQFGRKALAYHHHGPGAGFHVVEANDLG